MQIDYPGFSFIVDHQDPESKARLGRINTPHGTIETPAFIFCATKAAIKGGITPHQLKDHDTQIILGNTYHLMLQPGADLIDARGGLHRFMQWDGPMLTDSGGYQVFSMGHGSVSEEIKRRGHAPRRKSLLKITEEGAIFKSHLDGKKWVLTPELSIEIQQKLGADLIVTFDECTAFHDDRAYTEKSLGLTERWTLRSVQAFTQNQKRQQALYGVVQGGVYEDLRQRSARFLNDQPLFGIAVGGCLGQTKDQMYEVVTATMATLDTTQRPVHLLGIGGVQDIWEGVAQGIDTFDCVAPTRAGRHGSAYVRYPFADAKNKERINLRNQRFQDDDTQVDPECACYCCSHFSRAYIHHLFKTGEMLGPHLLTLHNIAFLNRMLQAIRQAIKENRLGDEKKNWIPV